MQQYFPRLGVLLGINYNLETRTECIKLVTYAVTQETS